MSIAVQQQQSQQATIAVSGRSASSCTPLVPGYPWHMHRSDFEAIGAYDAYADALRGFETMTNNRIAELRHFEGIPMDTLPGDDDLWLEVSVRDLAKWTVHAWGKTKYAEILDDPQLFELGFLCYRFVAYPGCYLLEPVETTIYQDLQGNPFIIVDDDAGNYIDEMGEQCNAKDQGYSLVRRQFLYCIENVNAALAKLTGQSPPAPMPRWHSLQKKGAQETTKSTLRTTHSFQTSAAQGCLDDEIKGIKAGSKLCVNKHNTVDGNLSSDLPEKLMSTNNLSSNSLLRSAPWSPETLIALAAHYLTIPDSNTVSEEQWLRDWAEPAQWLINFTKDLDCTRAWEIIERHVVGMLSGPTWYAQKRARKTSFTLRHVVGTDKNTAQLTGNTWHVVENELNTAQWYPDAHIEYAGPPLFDDCAESSYAQGYTAQPSPTAQPEEPTAQSDAQSLEIAHYVESTAQVLGDDAQTEPVVEVVAGDDCAVDLEDSAQSDAQPEHGSAHTLEVIDAQSLAMAAQTAQDEEPMLGMDITTTCIVDAQIRREYPDIIIGVREVDGLFLLGIEVALNQWYDIVSLADYLAPSPQTQEAIDAAEAYGRQRQATDSNGYCDSQGPPGYDEVSEGGDE